MKKNKSKIFSHKFLNKKIKIGLQKKYKLSMKFILKIVKSMKLSKKNFMRKWEIIKNKKKIFQKSNNRLKMLMKKSKI